MKPSTAAFENLVREAIQICQNERQENHPPTLPEEADRLHTLASSCQAKGWIDRAEELHGKALDIRLHTLGDNHPDVAASLVLLADLYESLNRHIEAEPMYRRALIIRQKSLGPWHPQVAECLDRIVALYQATNRSRTAILLAERASEIRGGKRLPREVPMPEAVLA